jgi:hypothetical protein
LPSRTRAQHRPRHAASHSYRGRFRTTPGAPGRSSRSGLTLGVVAATTAGAAAIAGITVGVSLGVIPGRSAPRPAAALSVSETRPSAGANQQNHPAAESHSRLKTGRTSTRSPAHSASADAQRTPSPKSSAKPSAAARHQAAAQHNAAARPTASASAAPSKPYEFYDSVEPQAVPAGAIVGTYSTGARPIPASAVAGRKKVLWIDTLATDPAGSGALDVEPGCATPSQVPGWVSSRLRSHPDQVAIVYMSLSEWPQVQADVASLPAWMRSRIRWWVADPTGVPHIVPGSQATQWYWGSTYDESMAVPGFQPDLVAGPSSA